MLQVLVFLLATLRDSLRTRVGLQAEVLALRHQRIIKRRPCEGAYRSASESWEPNCIPGMTKSTTKWSLATRGNLQGANVSFSRHGEIYRYGASPTASHFAVNGPGPSRLGRARIQGTSNRGGWMASNNVLPSGQGEVLPLWLLKNSRAEIALENRRARVPYKRFSPPRYTLLVTNFGSIFRNYGLFQPPRLTSFFMGPFLWEGDVGGQEMASPQRRTSR